MRKFFKTAFFLMTFFILSCDQISQERNTMTYNKFSQDNRISEKLGKTEKLKINIEIGGEILTASLENNETTQDLLKLLPMTITMKDLYESEKYAELPVELSGAGVSRQGYEIGDIGYWAPGNCLVIYYKQTGEIINGLQILGKIDENINIFEKNKNSVIVRISKSD